MSTNPTPSYAKISEWSTPYPLSSKLENAFLASESQSQPQGMVAVRLSDIGLYIHTDEEMKACVNTQVSFLPSIYVIAYSI